MATVTITINSVDDAVAITGDTTGSGAEGTQITGTLTAVDDIDGLTDGIYFVVTDGPANGSASIDAASGVWSYTPTAHYNGSDAFPVTVTDDDGYTAVQQISLSLTAVDDAVAITGDTTGSG